MSPAREPRPTGALRVLVVGDAGTRVVAARAFASILAAGDVVVVNDAATVPASIAARTQEGRDVELRLVGASGPHGAAPRYTAALLGEGSYRTRTEDRPPPPPVRQGDVLAAEGLVAEVTAVSAISPRLVDVAFAIPGRSAAPPAEIWAALYRAGRPVQYAHVPRPLALWDVQNVYASRPWAVEMPSAGRVLDGAALLALRARGVRVVSITHAAGLSSTGDRAIDACLPLPERWRVPDETADALAEARGRVVAVGTSVVRALESAARTPASSRAGRVVAGEGVTDLLLGPGTRRLAVDALLTGVHEADTTHFALLSAFAPRARLDAALADAEREGMLGHEFGDAWLVWGAPRSRRASALGAPRSRRACALGAPRSGW